MMSLSLGPRAHGVVMGNYLLQRTPLSGRTDIWMAQHIRKAFPAAFMCQLTTEFLLLPSLLFILLKKLLFLCVCVCVQTAGREEVRGLFPVCSRHDKPVDIVFSSQKQKSTVPAMPLLPVAVVVEASISDFSGNMQTVKCVLLVVFKSAFVFQIKDRNLFFLPGAQEVLIDPGT